MNLNFRSSLHGFNRQDVASYLEYLNNRHAAQVNQLNTDLEALRRQAAAPGEDPQRAALEARCRELEQQLETARKERDEALAQREAAEQKLASARQDREEALLRNIALRDELKQRLSDTRQWVAVMDGALGMLGKDDRTAVEVYISQEPYAAETLAERIGVERTTVYRRAGRALNRLTEVLFGL